LGAFVIKRFATLFVLAGLLASCSFNVKLPPLTTPTSTELVNAALLEIAVTQTNEAANTTDEIERMVYPKFSLAAGDSDIGNKIVQRLNQEIQSQLEAFELSAAGAFDENTSGGIKSTLDITVRKIQLDSDLVLVNTYSCEYLSGAAHGLCVPFTYAFSTLDGAAFTFVDFLQPGSESDFFDFVVTKLFEQVDAETLFSETEVREVLSEASFAAWWPYVDVVSFEFAPYEVAPYASGAIEIDLMSDEIMQFINPNSELAKLVLAQPE
jgi:hypothetical protein